MNGTTVTGRFCRPDNLETLRPPERVCRAAEVEATR